jgi:hypothetical protein
MAQHRARLNSRPTVSFWATSRPPLARTSARILALSAAADVLSTSRPSFHPIRTGLSIFPRSFFTFVFFGGVDYTTSATPHSRCPPLAKAPWRLERRTRRKSLPRLIPSSPSMRSARLSCCRPLWSVLSCSTLNITSPTITGTFHGPSSLYNPPSSIERACYPLVILC